MWKKFHLKKKESINIILNCIALKLKTSSSFLCLIFNTISMINIDKKIGVLKISNEGLVLENWLRRISILKNMQTVYI